MSSNAEAIELALKITAQGQAELENIAAALGKIGNESKGAGPNVGGLGSQIDNLKAKLSGMMGAAGDGRGALGGLGEMASSLLGKINPLSLAFAGGTLTLGAFVTQSRAAIKEMGDAAEAALNMAERTGLTTKEVSQFTNAAKLAGVDAGVFEQSMKSLSQVLSDNTEEGKRGKAALKELGVSVYDVNGQLRPMSEIFLALSDAIGGIESPTDRANAAMKVFGRAGREMIPLFAELRKNVDYFRDQGFGMDEETARELDRVADELSKIEAIWGRLASKAKRAIIIPIVPVVEFGREVSEILNAITGPKRALQSLHALMQRRAVVGFQAGLVQSGIDPYTRKLDAKQTEGLDILKREMDLLSRGDDAIRSRLEQKKRELAEQQARIEALYNDRQGQGLSKEPAEEEVKRAETLRREVAALEAQVKAAEDRRKAAEKLAAERERGTLRLTDLWAKDAEAAGRRKHSPPSLYRPGEVFVAAAFGRTDEERARESNEALGRGFLESLKRRQEMQKEMTAREIAARERLIELTAGPGGELEAAAKIRDLRLETAETVLDKQKAMLDYAVKEAEIRRSSIEKYREEAGRVFDAMTAKGGGGIRDFFSGQLKVLERQLFVNTSAGMFEKFGGFLGSVGEKSGLPGWLLKGTIFDPANKNSPEVASRDRNTKAVDRLTSAITGRPVAGAAGDVVGTFSSIGGLFGGLFGSGVDRNNPFIFHATNSPAPVTIDSLERVGMILPADPVAAVKVPNSASRWSKGIGYAGAAAAGVFGTIAGVQEGGARGAVTAGGSLVGAAGAILSLAGVSGPAAPILMGLGLGLGMIHSLFGDPKQQRDAEINRTLQASRYAEPSAVERSLDLYSGAETDYDYRGRVRVINKTTVTVPVQAMDSKSFLDRAHDIGLAMRKAIQDGNPVNDQILQTVGVNR